MRKVATGQGSVDELTMPPCHILWGSQAPGLDSLGTARYSDVFGKRSDKTSFLGGTPRKIKGVELGEGTELEPGPAEGGIRTAEYKKSQLESWKTARHKVN